MPGLPSPQEGPLPRTRAKVSLRPPYPACSAPLRVCLPQKRGGKACSLAPVYTPTRPLPPASEKGWNAPILQMKQIDLQVKQYLAMCLTPQLRQALLHHTHEEEKLGQGKMSSKQSYDSGHCSVGF